MKPIPNLLFFQEIILLTLYSQKIQIFLYLKPIRQVFILILGLWLVDILRLAPSSEYQFENCSKLLTKLDDNGHCKSIKRSKIGKVPELEPFQASEQLFWLRCACIMQGCDYYPTGLKGVGRFFDRINSAYIGQFWLKTSQKNHQRHKNWIETFEKCSWLWWPYS